MCGEVYVRYVANPRDVHPRCASEMCIENVEAVDNFSQFFTHSKEPHSLFCAPPPTLSLLRERQLKNYSHRNFRPPNFDKNCTAQFTGHLTTHTHTIVASIYIYIIQTSEIKVSAPSPKHHESSTNHRGD